MKQKKEKKSKKSGERQVVSNTETDKESRKRVEKRQKQIES